jgi:hypothetical protein
VGAKWEDSSATGVNRDENNNGAKDSGSAYVFVRNGNSWSQLAYLKDDGTYRGTNGGSSFGYSVAVDEYTVVGQQSRSITVFSRINISPNDITLNGATVEENSPINTVVGTLVTSDPDAEDTHTYSFAAGGADNSQFNINRNQLLTSATFDYETKNSYNIKIRTTDSSENYFEKAFTILVSDVNEQPTDLR